MQPKINQILEDLKRVKGLDNLFLISDSEKERLLKIESSNNKGVDACLKREFTLMVTHDSSFRGPTEKIVTKDDGKIIFPPVSFPEVKARNVVSSSPSSKVHKFLVRRFNLKLKDEEATLLIGFDL